MSNNYDDARLSAERHNDFYEYKRLGEPEKYAIIIYQKKNGCWAGQRYFRNALVRANYTDRKNNIYATTEFLNHFFANLLLGENNPLQNRELLALKH